MTYRLLFTNYTSVVNRTPIESKLDEIISVCEWSNVSTFILSDRDHGFVPSSKYIGQSSSKMSISK